MTQDHPIKVLIINHTTKMGGVENAMVTMLRRLDKSRVKPGVVLPDDYGPLAMALREFPCVNITVVPDQDSVLAIKRLDGTRRLITSPRLALGVLRIVWSLYTVIRREKPDLVFTNSIKPHLYGSLAAKLAGTPILWYMHEILDSSYYPFPLGKVLAIFAHLFPRLILCNSQATLESLHKAGVPSPKLFRRYPPIDIHDDSGTKTNIRQELGLAGDIPLVGIFGRISFPKGHLEFVQAARMASRQCPEVHFLIVGDSLFGGYDDDYKARVVAAIHHSPVKDRFHLIGFRLDARQIMAQTNVVVCPSQWPEGFGLVVAEAMILGRPVVSTAAGALVELVKPDVTGIQVAREDIKAMAAGIVALISDLDCAKAMGQAGRELICQLLSSDENVTWEQIFHSAAHGNESIEPL